MTDDHKALVGRLRRGGSREAAAAIESLSERAERAEAELAKAREMIDYSAFVKPPSKEMLDQIYQVADDAGEKVLVHDYKALYHELLYAVASKWPDETCHQTALRYIMNAERGSNQAQAAAKKTPAVESGEGS